MDAKLIRVRSNDPVLRFWVAAPSPGQKHHRYIRMTSSSEPRAKPEWKSRGPLHKCKGTFDCKYKYDGKCQRFTDDSRCEDHSSKHMQQKNLFRQLRSLGCGSSVAALHERGRKEGPAFRFPLTPLTLPNKKKRCQRSATILGTLPCAQKTQEGRFCGPCAVSCEQEETHVRAAM